MVSVYERPLGATSQDVYMQKEKVSSLIVNKKRKNVLHYPMMSVFLILLLLYLPLMLIFKYSGNDTPKTSHFAGCILFIFERAHLSFYSS